MKKDLKKTAKSSFEKEYKVIVKNFPTAAQQWGGNGDAFVKFSLYKNEPTVAKPYTTYIE